jgi:hypothetical protein
MREDRSLRRRGFSQRSVSQPITTNGGAHKMLVRHRARRTAASSNPAEILAPQRSSRPHVASALGSRRKARSRCCAIALHSRPSGERVASPRDARQQALSASSGEADGREIDDGNRMVRSLSALQTRPLVSARGHGQHDVPCVPRVSQGRHRYPGDVLDGRQLAPVDRFANHRGPTRVWTCDRVADSTIARHPARQVHLGGPAAGGGSVTAHERPRPALRTFDMACAR